MCLVRMHVMLVVIDFRSHCFDPPAVSTTAFSNSTGDSI